MNRHLRVLAFPAYKNKRSNPYNYLLYKSVECLGVEVHEFSFSKGFRLGYDLVHIHWPERFLNSASRLKASIGSLLLIVLLFWARLYGKKVIWTIHNLEPHHIKFPVLNRIFWRLYLPLVDGVISLSHSNLKLCLKHYPKFKGMPAAVTYHGLYKGIYPSHVSRDTARQEFSLETGASVCLFLGRVMRYKNIETLIDLFSKPALSTVKLIIAGRVEDESYLHELRTLIRSNDNIIMKAGFVADEDLQKYMKAANVMVLPFDKIFNSGSALLGVSFGVTVLVPYTENFYEYENVTSGLLKCYKGELSADHIEQAVASSFRRESETAEQLNKLEWNGIAESTLVFYKSIMKHT